MKNTSKLVMKKINSERWKDIAGFLIPWLKGSNKTIEQYYKWFSKRYKKQYKKKLPFTLEEVLAVLMFMSTEQIVIYDEEGWECIIFYFKEKDGKLIPEGFKIIPKIIIEGN